MLPRSGRISAGQFDTAMEKGRVFHSPFFLIRVLSGQADTRIAAVASKKVAKTAVMRNNIRRRVYEAVRQVKDTINPGIHILVFAKPTMIKATQADISADIKALFVKSGLLR